MTDTTPLHPELASSHVVPDAPATSYRAAADVLNAGTHAARDGFDPRPVDEDQLGERVDALHDAATALLIAAAVLRDAITGEDATTGDLLDQAVRNLGTAGTSLQTVRRHLAGPVTPDAGDDE